jgi:hypothetical protein
MPVHRQRGRTVNRHTAGIEGRSGYIVTLDGPPERMLAIRRRALPNGIISRAGLHKALS